jgi:hypothetical protein
MPFFQRSKQLAIHPNKHVVRMVDGPLFSCLEATGIRGEVQTMRSTDWRPHPMRAEPVVEVRDELEPLRPCQDAAGFENSTACLDEWRLDGSVLAGIACAANIPPGEYKRWFRACGDRLGPGSESSSPSHSLRR